MFKLTKIGSFKSVQQLESHLTSLGIQIPLDEIIQSEVESPLSRKAIWNGRTIGNRIAIQPMEGWDGTRDGGISKAMLRRWRRFGLSGAKLIWGGEAMAVRHEGRANPNQLVLVKDNSSGIGALLAELRSEHYANYSSLDDLVVGVQLTHSGRFCRPNGKQWEPRVAYRHPLLDTKFAVKRDDQVLGSSELELLIEDYVRAAKLAFEIGADFVDIKCCHGYLLHEFLSARDRDDRFGGSLENRMRLPLEIVSAIRTEVPLLGIGVRLSAIDTVPFEPDPATAVEGKLGQGRPCAYQSLLPYRWGFGVNAENPMLYDLTEPREFVSRLYQLGVKLFNISAGSPYYTPHLLRPAAYPPSDGYQPHEDPLISVAKHFEVTRELKQLFPDALFVGSGYSYLQDFIPHAAQHNVRNGWTDFVGLGRTVLSYPQVMMDAMRQQPSKRKLVCRTFSDCTTAPRNGLPSGCYPLDDYYKNTDTADKLKALRP